MKGRILPQALPLCLAASALILTSCETTQDRISKHPEIYQRLSASDQALVGQGQIRAGMSQNAVWLAWGGPQRKIIGNMRGQPTETWIYITYETAPYPYGGPYGPWGWCCFCPDTSSRALVCILRQPLLRSVLLCLHSAEHSSPVQDRHIRQWAHSVIPVHGTPLVS